MTRCAATGDQKSDKSPLAEYMGDGFVSSSGGGMRIAVRAGGGQGSSEEELAKQRKVEDATAACMKAAGFEYVAVPPESNPKSKFDDAFNLPPDKFAEQYGYGISTIDWSKAGADDDTNPNTKIRNALSATAQEGLRQGAERAERDRQRQHRDRCRRKATARQQRQDGPRAAGARRSRRSTARARTARPTSRSTTACSRTSRRCAKRIEADQRVVDATTAWADCLADAGQAGYKKIDEPREKVSQKLDELTGKTTQPTGSNPGKTVMGPPSFDKVDATKLADLRKFEIDLAVADQKCKAKVYDEAYKKVQYEQEKEFVDAAQGRARGVPRRNGEPVTASPKSRRRVLVGVSAVATVSLGVGVAAGSRITSPEDAAAKTAAPKASQITVPVEKKALSSKVVGRGDASFDGAVNIRVETSGLTTPAIVTGKVPTVGSTITEGKALLEITGRPVIGLAGVLPMYRTLSPGQPRVRTCSSSSRRWTGSGSTRARSTTSTTATPSQRSSGSTRRPGTTLPSRTSNSPRPSTAPRRASTR